MNLTSASPGNHSEIYTSLIDSLFGELTAHEAIGFEQRRIDRTIIDIRKYYDWAINYEKAIILAAEGMSYPHFQIKLCDLSPALKKALGAMKAACLFFGHEPDIAESVYSREDN